MQCYNNIHYTLFYSIIACNIIISFHVGAKRRLKIQSPIVNRPLKAKGVLGMAALLFSNYSSYLTLTLGGKLDTYNFLIGIPSSVCVGTNLESSELLDSISVSSVKKYYTIIIFFEVHDTIFSLKKTVIT